MLAATGRPLPPDWALQDPEDYLDVLRHAVPAAVADAGIDPAQVIGIGTDFTACTVLPVPGRRHAALRVRGAARPAARLAEALEAPRRAAAGGPDQRAGARARRAVARPLRREDLVRVAVRQGAADAGGGPGHLPARRPLDRGRRLDHLAADRRRDQQRVHRRVQGHLPGRRTIRRASTWPRWTPVSPGSPTTSWTHPISALGARAGSLTAQRRGLDRPAARHRGRGRQRGRARDPARRERDRPGQMVAIMGTSTCHVMNGDDAGRGAGHVRRGRWRDRGRAVRLRGGPERRR